MDEKRQSADKLRDLFARLPETQVSAGFRSSLMEKVAGEAVRMKKRRERNGLLVTIALAVFFLVAGVGMLVWLGLSKVDLRIPDFSMLPFFAYIGALVFILLTLDHKARKRFYEKHSE